MNTATQIAIGLDTSGRKFNCPSCGQKRFVRMYDFEIKEYLPEDVGRCDRENNCGYHLTAKQYFNNKGIGYKPVKKEIEAKPEVIDFMPVEYVQQSMNGYQESNFALWLASLFGEDIAKAALIKYFVGRSKNDNGKACIFWRIDIEGNVRSGKIIPYHLETGKRNKEGFITWVHSQKKTNGEYLFPQPYNFKLCFFGENLLAEYPNKKVFLFESEKTAIIASIYFPDYISLATGGNSGCKWTDYSVYKVLRDRDVILFPDFGFFNVKTQRTCYQEWVDRAERLKTVAKSVIVSRLLEDKIDPKERVKDYDLADMLIKQKDGKGWALDAEYDYPVMWDLNSIQVHNTLNK